MILDAHQHIWSLSRGDYGWLTPDAGALYRDFTPVDFAAAATFVDASILVQAAPTVVETRFLLDEALGSSRIAGVVGWVDLAARDASDQLAALAAHPKFLGVRPMLQDLADPDWIDAVTLDPAIRALTALGLTFDALVRAEHLPALTRMAARHPGLRIIIDHAAKPAIGAMPIDDWVGAMAPLAAMPQVCCKLSGLITEAGPGWRPETVQLWIQAIIALFGTDRVLWGSDWPVLTGLADIPTWFDLVREVVAPLGEVALADVFGRTALRVYGIRQEASEWVRD